MPPRALDHPGQTSEGADREAGQLARGSLDTWCFWFGLIWFLAG